MESLGIVAIAMRRTENSHRIELKFIHALYMPHCGHEMMRKIITNNKAKDAYEHTGEFIDIPLSADERVEAKCILGHTKINLINMYVIQ